MHRCLLNARVDEPFRFHKNVSLTEPGQVPKIRLSFRIGGVGTFAGEPRRGLFAGNRAGIDSRAVAKASAA
jgi:hypothetical protein